MLHMRVHEPKNCPVCNERVIGQMAVHMRRHVSYECYICHTEYKTGTGMKNHMQLKHVGGDEFYCDICNDGYNFRSITYLKIHIKRHAAKMKAERTVQPPDEHSQIEWVRAIEERWRKRFTGDNERISEASTTPAEWKKCRTCGKEFTTERQYSLHIQRHDKSKWKKCPLCDKSFYTNLSRHINNTHNKAKNHVCHLCGIAYSQSPSLKEHMAVKHSTDEQFFCDICHNLRAYSSRLALKKHLETHATTNLKKSESIGNVRLRNGKKFPFYKCNHCKEEFPSSYRLRAHKNVKHFNGNANGAPFRCNICDKEFVMKR